MNKIRYLGWLFFIIISLVISDYRVVQACSGPGQAPIRMKIDEATYIAVGSFIRLDDAKANGILFVDYTLKGEKIDQHILVSTASQAQASPLYAYRRPRCSYGRGVMTEGQRVIALLRRNLDGSYSPTPLGPAIFTFDDNQTQHIYMGFDEDAPVQHLFQDFTYEALLAYIGDVVDGLAQPPRTTRKMPRLAPLYLITTTGERYVLPIDRNTSEAIDKTYISETESMSICLEAVCRVTSPNRLDSVVIGPDLTHSGDGGHYYRIEGYPVEVAGSRALFSPASDSLAIWYEDSLEIYVLPYPHLTGELFTDGLTRINRVELQASPIDSAGLAAAWSPDSRLLAFSNTAGLWMWDALTAGAVPQLLLAADDNIIPIPLAFSATGRFLHIETRVKRQHLDLVSRTFYPDGLLSPGDRNILLFDTRATPPFNIANAIFTPVFQTFATHHVLQVEWISPTAYLYAQCGQASREIEAPPEFQQDWCYIFRLSPSPMASSQILAAGFAFDYLPTTHDLATLVNATTIIINGESIALDGQLNGEIVEIAWGTPLFYWQK
jgi:hypothetical protein